MHFANSLASEMFPSAKIKWSVYKKVKLRNNVNLRKFGEVSNNGSKTIGLIIIETQGRKYKLIKLESWEVVLFVALLMMSSLLDFRWPCLYTMHANDWAFLSESTYLHCLICEGWRNAVSLSKLSSSESWQRTLNICFCLKLFEKDENPAW